MGELKKWLDQDWVRIGTDGSIKVRVELQKIKRGLIVVFQGPKLIVLANLKELKLLVKRNVRAAKAKLLSLILRRQK